MPETRRLYAGGMSIIIERNDWEPELRYYFRSCHGATPICELTKKGEHWEVLFYRGATNPGPHVYQDFERAKRHILRYVEPREAELQGELARWVTHGQGHTARGASPGSAALERPMPAAGNPVTEDIQWVGKRKARARRRYR